MSENRLLNCIGIQSTANGVFLYFFQRSDGQSSKIPLWL